MSEAMPYGDVLDTGEQRPRFGEALRFWLKLGCISFGGPAGQIAIMQHELVDGRRWIGQRAFLRALNFCTLLPGPEAQQLATYIGWRLHGVRGGIAAGGLFVIPGAVVMLGLSWLAAAGRDVAWVAAVFDGLKPVVMAIVLHAVWRIGKRALKGWEAVALALAAFVAIRILGIDFPWIVLAAGLVGWASVRDGRSPFTAGHGDVDAAFDEPAATGFWGRVARVGVVALALWGAAVLLALLLFGPRPMLDVAALFTKAAFVTFGGAYAVLPYVAEEAVATYAWLSPGEMLDGLALAETTPGPLILVLQYVGFFAGWNASGGALAPAVAAALLATWVTFLPSFAFIFIAGPWVERLHGDARIGAALGAVTAAVVGVILNLAVFLAWPVFLPAPGRVDFAAIAVAAIAFGVLLRFNPAIHWMVAAGAAWGLVRAALAGSLG